MDVSGIINDLVDHGFDDASTERLLAVINETYHDVCDGQPWRFLETSVDLEFDGTTGVPTNWPTDFRTLVAIFRKADGTKVEHIRYDDFIAGYAMNLNYIASPLLYYFQGTQLKAYPIPQATDVVTMEYIREPTELTETDIEANILIPKRYHRATLVNGSLYKLYLMEDDPELSSSFKALYDQAFLKMSASWLIQIDRSDYIHHVDPDDVDDFIDFF